MTTSIIRAGGTGVPGVQTTGGDDGALALKVGPLAATVEALSITTAGSVGIGTTSPSAILQTSTTSDGAQAIFVGAQSTNEQTLIFRNQYYTNNSTAGVAAIGWIDSGSSGGLLTFKTGTNGGGVTNIPTERMRIDNVGNVGIGTTAIESGFKLHVTGNGFFSPSSGTVGRVVVDNSDQRLVLGSYYESGVGQYSFISSTNNAESGNLALAFRTGTTERMRIDASGNVGIGTAAPAYPLTLGNNKQFGALNTGGSAVTLAILNGSNNLVFGDDSANTGNLTVQSRAETKFILNGAERMRISSAGTVSLGTTVDNPVGNRVDGIALFGSGAVRSRAPTGASYFGLNVTNGVNLYFYTDNGSAFVTGGNIATNGATTAYNATSDYRLKNNIQPLTDALSRVALLRPVKWTWKEELGGTDPNGEGFVAHELAEILPMAVTGEKDELDEDGKPKYQGVDTKFLVATLTAAIQEQQALIEALTTRITALEG